MTAVYNGPLSSTGVLFQDNTKGSPYYTFKIIDDGKGSLLAVETSNDAVAWVAATGGYAMSVSPPSPLSGNSLTGKGIYQFPTPNRHVRVRVHSYVGGDVELTADGTIDPPVTISGSVLDPNVINAKLDLKADKTSLDAKADKTALGTALDAKVNKSELDTALNAKADKTSLDAKADKVDLTAKADKTALDLKADKSAVDLKADKTDLNTKAQKGANSDITSLTGLTTPLSQGQGGTGVNVLSNIPVDLGLPAILTLAQEVKSRNVVPAARLGITGGSSDQTYQWLMAIGSALLEYQRPVELNTGASHRIGARLKFPAGSGIVNPGGSSIIGDCIDFNNTSRDVNLRYGSNAVMLAAEQSKGVRFEGVKLTLQAGSSSTFNDRYVQGLVAQVCSDLTVIDADISGLNAGSMINLQSCKNFRLVRPYCHDGIVHTGNTNRAQTQLTGITIDGDEALDNGQKIGSTGRIEFPRIVNLRATAQVIAATTEQTDGINIAGNNADVLVLYPYVENVNEAIDCFGRLELIGGRFVNTGNFGVKLVHGAQNCRFTGFQSFNAGIAGITLQSTSDEVRGISNNEIRGAVYNVGQLNVPMLTINGVTAPEILVPPNAPGDTFEVLLVDTNPTYPVENNLVEVDIQGSGRSTNAIRVTANGSGNTVRYTNRDGTTDSKTPVISGNNTVRRTDKNTNIIAYAGSAQSFPTTTAVVNYGNEILDTLGEWTGTTFFPKLAGRYLVSASIRFGGSPGDTITFSIRLNNIVKKSDVRAYAAGELVAAVSHVLNLTLGDKVDIVTLLNRAQDNTSGEQYTAVTITRLQD